MQFTYNCSAATSERESVQKHRNGQAGEENWKWCPGEVLYELLDVVAETTVRSKKECIGKGPDRVKSRWRKKNLENLGIFMAYLGRPTTSVK